MSALTPANEPRLTRNQAKVFNVLAESRAPLSAYTILDALRDDGFRAPLQVYRALEKLVDLGLVHRLESLNAFVACSHEKCHGAGLMAFAICDACGTVSEFADRSIAQRLESWSSDSGFQINETTMEIHGTCDLCRAA